MLASYFMLGRALEDIGFSDIVAFLDTGVREGAALDFKVDFPSDLEKTISAFANTYGGIILIGVGETTTGGAISPPVGVELKPGLRERVLQKSLEAIYPPLLPDVQVLEFQSHSALTSPDRAIVIVRVAEGAEAPHAVNQRTTVYLRGDNVSTRPERKATIGEIEWLTNKRGRSRELKERLFSQVQERAEYSRARRRRRSPGQKYWREGSMTFSLVPSFPRLPLMDPRLWLTNVESSSVFIDFPPHRVPFGTVQRVSGGAIFDAEYVHSDYQSQGLIFHEVDYWWNYVGQQVQIVRLQLYPRATAALFHAVLQNALKVYEHASYSGSIEFKFGATGLTDSFFSNSENYTGQIPYLPQSAVQIERTFTVAELHDDWRAIAVGCQRELYWTFGFDVPDERIRRDFAPGAS